MVEFNGDADSLTILSPLARVSGTPPCDVTELEKKSCLKIRAMRSLFQLFV